MTTEPATARRTDVASTHPDDWIGITAKDIPHGWIDNMVKRLFDELNCELIRMEKVSAQEPDRKDVTGRHVEDVHARDLKSRTLDRLQRSLERLTKMEMQRASLRATKTTAKPRDARAKNERTILAAIESGDAPQGAGGAR